MFVSVWPICHGDKFVNSLLSYIGLGANKSESLGEIIIFVYSSISSIVHNNSEVKKFYVLTSGPSRHHKHTDPCLIFTNSALWAELV